MIKITSNNDQELEKKSLYAVSDIVKSQLLVAEFQECCVRIN